MIDEDQVTLGRGHDADVRVTDISVSRCHAIIKKSPLGFFYIVDNVSKFGTLALVRQPQLINSACNNCYQIGKTLIKFKIEELEDEKAEKKKKILCPCFEPKEDEDEAKKKKLVNELINNAPVKEELVTHDGILYFPKELMPPEPEETLQYSARLGFKGNAASTFLLKSKKLNLKLKIKKPTHKVNNS